MRILRKVNNEDILELNSRMSYDSQTGIFTYKKHVLPCRKAGAVAGYVNGFGYVGIRFKSKNYQAHRLAWLFHYGEMPEIFIDHIDGNRANNAISNLRLANYVENGQNQKKASLANKTGFLGVCKIRNKKNPYRATICNNGKNIVLGHYPTAEEAHAAYIAKKKEIHPFFVETAQPQQINTLLYT